MDRLTNLLTSLHDNMFVISLFIDLSKAFDCLDHEILLHKLFNYGVRGFSLDLIKSYLSYRTQVVTYKGVVPESENICCGVPQGVQFWGPHYLLFISMTCIDVPLNLTSYMLMILMH